MPVRILLAGCVLAALAAVALGSPDPPMTPPPPTMAERIQRMQPLRAAQPSTRVHAVLVGDTEQDDLGAAIDLAGVRKLLTDSLGGGEVVITEVRGKGPLKRAVLDARAGLP